ncbi:MAG: multiheme c-type cytochrome [Candidatus Aminicenantales bacterium]
MSSMKWTVSIAAALIIAAASAAMQSSTYVGSKKCSLCHKNEHLGAQYKIWESTLHSKSLASLSGPNAAVPAEAMSVSSPTEDPKCLRCHGPFFEKDPDFITEGVSCEICHGPGSGYAKLSIMKNKEEAIKKGLVLYGTQDKIKAFCLTCHDNPHSKPFDFAAGWEKMKHPIPQK